MPQEAVLGPTREEFGQHVRALRLALGWTLEELAMRVGVTAHVLEDVELGRDELDVNRMFDLARGLGMTVATIFRLWERGAVIAARDLGAETKDN
jgi:transcriptional regulator with XRE-family HTH domain